MRTIEVKGDVLRQQRENLNLTIKELAKTSNQHFDSLCYKIRKWEQREILQYKPRNYGDLIDLAKLYQIDVRELIRRSTDGGVTEAEVKTFLDEMPKDGTLKTRLKNERRD